MVWLGSWHRGVAHDLAARLHYPPSLGSQRRLRNLILLAWAVGLNTRLDTWGPPPLERMTKLFLEMSATDIDTRTADEAHPPLAPLVHTHEITSARVVLEDGNVKVTSAVVPHPLIELALAYRFDGPDRSIVISGDTAPSDTLIPLARGADVLVHEAMYLPALDRIAARTPSASRLKQHLLASHSAEDAGRVAQAAVSSCLYCLIWSGR